MEQDPPEWDQERDAPGAIAPAPIRRVLPTRRVEAASARELAKEFLAGDAAGAWDAAAFAALGVKAPWGQARLAPPAAFATWTWNGKTCNSKPAPYNRLWRPSINGSPGWKTKLHKSNGTRLRRETPASRFGEAGVSLPPWKVSHHYLRGNRTKRNKERGDANRNA